MIIKISGIQIFTEIEIGIFEKVVSKHWVIPRQLDQAMTPMATDLSDYFLQ
jgi:hypothetical protein